MNAPLNKTNLVLLGLFVVQAIALFVVGISPAETPTRSKEDAAVSGRKPFDSLDATRIRVIEAKKRDAAPVRLEKTTSKDGDKDVVAWTLADRDGHPAKTSEVDRMIESLKKLTFTRIVTKNPTRHAGLNVGDGASDAHIRILGENGATLADVRLGESKDYRTLHVRLTGEDAVYGASGAGLFDFAAEAQSVAETKLLDVELGSIVGFRATNESGSYEVELKTPVAAPESRPESQPESGPESRATPPPVDPPYWVTKGDAPQKLDKNKVETFLRGFGKCSLGEPIGKEQKPEYGLDAPTATLTLVLKDGGEITTKIGAERKDQYDWYALSSAMDRVVTIKSYNVTDWFKKPLKDLLPVAADAPEDD